MSKVCKIGVPVKLENEETELIKSKLVELTHEGILPIIESNYPFFYIRQGLDNPSFVTRTIRLDEDTIESLRVWSVKTGYSIKMITCLLLLKGSELNG